MIVSPSLRPRLFPGHGSPAPRVRRGRPAPSWVLLAALLSLPILAAPLSGQLLTRGDVEGVVRAGGLPVADASVSIMPEGGGATLEQLPPRDGRFSFRALVPGRYEVRVEAVGYRPLVIRGIELAPGRAAVVPVELVREPPPVTRVDTLLMTAAAGERSEPGLVTWIPTPSLDGLPDRNRRVADLDRLVPRRQGPGFEGLPEQASVVALDGVLLRPAMRTGSGVDPEGSVPLPRNALGAVAMMGVGDDPEWGLAPGGVVALVPAVGGSGGGSSLWAAGSGAGLWTSGQFSGPVPDVTSFWGGGKAAFSLDGDRGRGLVAAEARRVQTPRPAAVFDAGLSAILARSDLPGDVASLARPGLDETTAISVMSRVDWVGGDGRGGGATVAFGRSETTGAPVGSTPVPFSDPQAGVRSDLAAVVNYLVPVGERVRLEARGGVYRTERDPPSGSTPGAAGALLVEPGGALGTAPGFPGRVKRSTATGTALVHFWDGNQYAKGGVEGRLSAHERDGLPGQRGEFAFDGLSGFAQGRGATRVVLPGPGEGSFQIPAYGVFLRVGWTPRPGLEFSAGGRKDVEFLPSDIRPDTIWGRLTGLVNTLPSSAGGVSGSAGMSWDPDGDGATLIRLAGGIYRGEMDPGMLADLIQLDGRARVRRSLGPAPGWPSAPSVGQEGALLALPGLDVTPPMSLRGSAGVLRRLGSASTLEIHGVVRRSSGLIRVADLNLIRLPRATLGGRDIFGIPSREGALLGAEPGSNRLFPAYDAVWAQNTDGRSDYLGVGGSFSQAGPAWGVRASVLFSRTEDNLPGLLSGDPLAGLNPFPLREEDWREGRSDLDLPHRAVVEGRLAIPGVDGGELSAVYTFRSGLPFTPGFRPGVDLNGDGSWSNDPAILTGNPDVAPLLAQWGCELPEEEGILPRNGCRGQNVHDLDLRLVVGVSIGGLSLALTGEVLGVFERSEGLRDTALYLVDRSGTLDLSPEGALTVPLVANPDFGKVLRPSIPGRLFRIGFRLTP